MHKNNLSIRSAETKTLRQNTEAECSVRAHVSWSVFLHAQIEPLKLLTVNNVLDEEPGPCDCVLFE